MARMRADERWDVFCRVVDNFGDVGVSWRLARILAAEHGKRVRLWLDDLAVLAALRPGIDRSAQSQDLDGVTIERMREAFAPGDVADVVIETFGCDPPAGYVEAMTRRSPAPRWINLEYLSAELWVEGSHALPSPHPRLPIMKHYFFPGFTSRTGGLLRERDLFRRRDAFQGDPGVQAGFWQALTGDTPAGGALKVSLFCYEGAPIGALLEACAGLDVPVWIIAPEGIAARALEGWSGERRGADCGQVEAFIVPFLPQDRYDELLWACDVNFVRGEDSFVRAQWAGRPFVWHIYPQKEDAHWVKLHAFLERYLGALDAGRAAAVKALWEAWNRGEAPPEEGPQPLAGWEAFAEERIAIQAATRAWVERLRMQQDLGSQLVLFATNLIK